MATILMVCGVVSTASPGVLVAQGRDSVATTQTRFVLLPNGDVISLAQLGLASFQSSARVNDAVLLSTRSLNGTTRRNTTNSEYVFEQSALAALSAQFDPDLIANDVQTAIYDFGEDYFFQAASGSAYTAEELDANNALVWVGPVTSGYAALQSGHNPVQRDSDGDEIPDVIDNCTFNANGPRDAGTAGPSQNDTDGDGFGNVCDADFDGNCVVNFVDLGSLRARFFQNGALSEDLNGDGVVNVIDLGLLRQQFFGPPGPSALATCP
ncbi:MAG: thrombospondin type 3 repeat-containing protein [Pseudomonadota bacterium]